MRYVSTMFIEPNELTELEYILYKTKAYPDHQANEVIKSYSIHFANGIAATINVCNGTPPYLTAVLTKTGEAKTESLQTVDHFSLQELKQGYAIKSQGDFYVVYLRRNNISGKIVAWLRKHILNDYINAQQKSWGRKWQ